MKPIESKAEATSWKDNFVMISERKVAFDLVSFVSISTCSAKLHREQWRDGKWQKNFVEQTEIRMLLLPLTSSSAIIGITEMSRVPFQKSDQTGREKFGQESKTTSRFGSGRWLLLLLPPMPLWRPDFESDDTNYPSWAAELVTAWDYVCAIEKPCDVGSRPCQSNLYLLLGFYW